MEYKNKMAVENEARDSSILTRNSRITQLLELVFNPPEANEEMQNMLLKFWDKYENCVSQDKDYCEFDVLCMYALDYAYKRNGPTQSAVSRSVYCYLKQIKLCTENRNSIISCTNSCFVKHLRDFTSFNSAEGEDILVDAFIESFLGGNLGLSQFLLKFGLVEFPSEANKKTRKIIEKLVNFFNAVFSRRGDENRPEEDRISIQSDDLFNQMQQNKNQNFRRVIFVFCYICIIAEYKAFEELEMRYNRHELLTYLKLFCYEKSKCLALFIETTTETIITFKDVDKFLSTVLSKQLNEAVRISLQKTTRKMFCKMQNYYNPRSLKHLGRSKTRECLRNSAVLPKSVYQLPIPVTLKKFVAFEEKEIWKTLKNDQKIIHSQYKLSRWQRNVV